MGRRRLPRKRWQAALVVTAVGGAGAAVLLPSAQAALPAPQDCTASWYGARDEGVEGAATASGAPFHAAEMTAASRTLPFGTVVTVTDRRTSRSVTVKVTDRGPFTDPGHRCLDLSAGAFAALGADLCAGLAEVRVAPVAPGTALTARRPDFRPISMADCAPGSGDPGPDPEPDPAPSPTRPEPTPTPSPSPSPSSSATATPSATPSPTPAVDTPHPDPAATHDARWWQQEWQRQIEEMVATQQRMIDEQRRQIEAQQKLIADRRGS
ncbi:septal ring lytic transglycosylase RlpA family protein [Kitasatospora sp. NPDC094015]|uniref:septal ring lytic transglycosylase RlpA family protein n=1 Tax=Kitasatospora sp. NPDC094015 TaxID=3155205 RepID=UPI00333011D0